MSQDSSQKPRIDLHDDRRSFRDSLFPGILRRTLETAAATEDAIRGVVGDIKMPKEVAAYIIEVADTTKKEVVRVAAREFREFLESANLTDELAKILTTLSFEIRTEVRFIPNDQALRPNVKSQVRLKSQDGEIDEPVRRDSKLVEGIDDIMRGVAGDITDRLLRRRKEPGASDEPAPVQKDVSADAQSQVPDRKVETVAADASAPGTSRASSKAQDSPKPEARSGTANTEDTAAAKKPRSTTRSARSRSKSASSSAANPKSRSRSSSRSSD